MQSQFSTDNIRVILCNTSHPGNIGAAARAMKTMGLRKLYLVNPMAFPDPKAVELAVQADDVLAEAVVVDTLAEAVQDCGLILGTSSRERALQWPTFNPRESAERAVQEAQHTQVALLFGNERTGLLNEELQYCHYQVVIPANPAYNSLNLAAAVQVLAYEIQVAMLAKQEPAVAEVDGNYLNELATAAELEGLYQHLEQILIATEFIDPRQPKQLMGRLRRLFNRTRLDKREINILRGIFTAVQQHLQ